MDINKALQSMMDGAVAGGSPTVPNPFGGAPISPQQEMLLRSRAATLKDTGGLSPDSNAYQGNDPLGTGIAEGNRGRIQVPPPQYGGTGIAEGNRGSVQVSGPAPAPAPSNNPYGNLQAYQQAVAAQTAANAPNETPPLSAAMAATGVGGMAGGAPANQTTPYSSLAVDQMLTSMIPKGMAGEGQTMQQLYDVANKSRDFSPIESLWSQIDQKAIANRGGPATLNPGLSLAPGMSDYTPEQLDRAIRSMNAMPAPPPPPGDDVDPFTAGRLNMMDFSPQQIASIKDRYAARTSERKANLERDQATSDRAFKLQEMQGKTQKEIEGIRQATETTRYEGTKAERTREGARNAGEARKKELRAENALMIANGKPAIYSDSAIEDAGQKASDKYSADSAADSGGAKTTTPQSATGPGAATPPKGRDLVEIQKWLTATGSPNKDGKVIVDPMKLAQSITGGITDPAQLAAITPAQLAPIADELAKRPGGIVAALDVLNKEAAKMMVIGTGLANPSIGDNHPSVRANPKSGYGRFMTRNAEGDYPVPVGVGRQLVWPSGETYDVEDAIPNRGLGGFSAEEKLGTMENYTTLSHAIALLHRRLKEAK